MKTVTFSFSSAATPERRMSVLESVNSWSAISRAGLLKPAAKSESVRLMAYANINDGADPDEVAKRLSELPEVETESVSVAPSRRLV